MVRQDITKGSVEALQNIDHVEKDVDQGKFLGAITEEESKPWFTTLNVNKRPINFKIDTGADVTVIPEEVYSRKRDGPLQQPQTPLYGPGQYTGSFWMF